MSERVSLSGPSSQRSARERALTSDLASLSPPVPRGPDHSAEADRSGLQGELLAGPGLQGRPEEEPLQRRLHAASPRGPSLLPAAVPGVGRAPR